MVTAHVSYKPRLKELYEKQVVPKLMKQFGYKNVMQVPRLEKIVINMGTGEGREDARFIDAAVKELSMITGQKPVVRRAKKSIAGFKLRAGQPIGVMVTLRRERMWEFLDRLINVALPRIRDFKGLPAKSFDGRGNYTVGVEEQLIFPELSYDDIMKVRGMNVTVVTTARTDEEAAALLRGLGMPLQET